MSRSERPLYFLHIPKTAGSSLTRLLEDAFPAGAVCPHRRALELDGPQRLSGYEVIAGHLGLLPVSSMAKPPVTVTVLREPVARTWSHFRALRDAGALHRHDRADALSLDAFLEHSHYAATSMDYQARWLVTTPRFGSSPGRAVGLDLPGPDQASASDGPAGASLEERAGDTLTACALVGTVDRLDDFVAALGRLLGRRLPAPPMLNGAAREETIGGSQAEKIRQRSPIDARLHEEAGRRLDRALAELAALPPEPPAALPYEQTMADPLDGTGWHARVHTDTAGWHRWTGPGTTSTVRLPVRLGGGARLELDIVSACDDDAVRSLRLEVQGRAVAHRLEPRRVGVRAVAEVELDPDRPTGLTVSVDRARLLREPATGAAGGDIAGLAVGDIRLRRAG